MRVFKLIFTSFVVFSLLSACTSGEKPQAKEQEFSILGTWDFQKIDPWNMDREIILKEDNKVIIKFQKSGSKIGKCTHLEEFEGRYNFDSKTNKLSFEENFIRVRGMANIGVEKVKYICIESDPDAKILATNSDLFGPSFTDYYVVKDGDYLSITFDCLDHVENAVYKKKIQ